MIRPEEWQPETRVRFSFILRHSTISFQRTNRYYPNFNLLGMPDDVFVSNATPNPNQSPTSKASRPMHLHRLLPGIPIPQPDIQTPQIVVMDVDAGVERAQRLVKGMSKSEYSNFLFFSFISLYSPNIHQKCCRSRTTLCSNSMAI